MIVSFSPTAALVANTSSYTYTPLLQTSQKHSHCRQLALSSSCVLSPGVQNTFEPMTLLNVVIFIHKILQAFKVRVPSRLSVG